MKKVIFLMGIIGFYCISCTSSKESLGGVTVQQYYNGNTYAQKYLNNPHLLTGNDAMAYIKSFKKHKYRIFGKKTLDNPWSTFDRDMLDSIGNDPETDSIFFFLAAFPKKNKSVAKEKRGDPFVILEAIPKSSTYEKGKGSAESPYYTAKSAFFSPVGLCPPPNTGCRMPGN